MPAAVKTIDAQELYLIPGAIDLHVHFRDPGMTSKETFATGSKAAAVGGVTTIFDMPNVIPAIRDVESFHLKRSIAAEKSYVNYGLYAFLEGSNLDQIEPLIDAGVAGFKWAMTLTAESWALPNGYQELENGAALEAFRRIGRHGYNVGVHAEDVSIVKTLIEELKQTGRTDTRAHLDSRPDYVEVVALERALRLSEITGCHLHVHHLTSRRGLELIKHHRQQGVRVTSEACPPWLYFSADDYDRLGPLIKVTPAIKEKEDARALWAGLVDGSIECYATDHAPHTHEEKLGRSWHETLPGANGVETGISLMLDKINQGELTIQRLVEMACENPARIYGLFPRKGVIEVGADADLVLIDIDRKWTITSGEMHSQNKVTPFDGFEVQGMPTMTFVNGYLVAQDRQIVGEPGHGVLVNARRAW